MDSYGNGKEIIRFLLIPMEMVRNHWIPMDSYGNGKEITGFLWIPMEMVRKSLDSWK